MKLHWKLTRGQRTLRNLVLGALLLTLIWGLAGYPLPGELEIRRLEREYLMGSTQVVCKHRTEDSVTLLTEGEGWITVGKATKVQSGDWPVSSQMIPCLNHVLPKEGIVAVALPGPGEGDALTVAVWGAPAEAVSGTLELDLIGVDGGVFPTPDKETFTAQGSREENGWVFFRFAPHPDHPGREICAISALWEWDCRMLYRCVGEYPYRLTLTDSQGKEVASQCGTLPPNLMLFDRG